MHKVLLTAVYTFIGRSVFKFWGLEGILSDHIELKSESIRCKMQSSIANITSWHTVFHKTDTAAHVMGT